MIGSYEEYLPNGSTPPEIPDHFDSRIVIKDGIKVRTTKNAFCYDYLVTLCIFERCATLFSMTA